jgi:hypothetical protein
MRPLNLLISVILGYSMTANASVPEDFIASLKTAKVVEGRFELERSQINSEGRQYTVTNIDQLVLSVPGKGQFEVLYDRYGNEMEIEVLKPDTPGKKQAAFIVDAMDSETRLIHEQLLSLTRSTRLQGVTLTNASVGLLENSLITKIIFGIETNSTGTRTIGSPLSFELLTSKGELVHVEFDVQKNEVEAFIDVTDKLGNTKFKTAYNEVSQSLRAALLAKAEDLKKFYIPAEQHKRVLGESTKPALTERLKSFARGGQQKSSQSFALELIPGWEVQGFQQGHQSAWEFHNYFNELATPVRSCAKIFTN